MRRVSLLCLLLSLPLVLSTESFQKSDALPENVIVGTGDALYGAFRVALIQHRAEPAHPLAPELLTDIEAFTGISLDSTSLGADDKALQEYPWAFLESEKPLHWSKRSEENLIRYLRTGGLLVVVEQGEDVVQELISLVDRKFGSKVLSLKLLAQTYEGGPSLRLLSLSDAPALLLLDARNWHPGVLEPLRSSLIETLRGQISHSTKLRRYEQDPLRVTGVWRKGELDLEAAVQTGLMNATAKLTVQVLGPLGGDGQPEFEMTRIRHISQVSGLTSQVSGLTFRLKESQLSTASVRCTLETPEFHYAESHALTDVLRTLDTRLLGQTTWQQGAAASLRVVTTERGVDMPLAGASVRVMEQMGDVERVLFEGKTDRTGSLDVQIPPERIPETDFTLNVRVESPLGDDTLQQPIQIELPRKILLSTDKPLYQPGQTMQLRALALNGANRKPLAEQEITLEIEDSKGNKVFKRPGKTDPFGIVSAEFQIADEVNLGRYTVRAVMGETTQEKKVTLDRYVLPKFKVQFETDREYYRPGETVKGEIQADYFFGKPVTEANVTVKASKFDVGFDQFAEANVHTDSEGHASFEIELPPAFVGLPLEQGNAFVQFGISVVDGAEHEEKIVRRRPMVASPIRILAVPETQTLSGQFETELYVMTSSPDGKPLKTMVTLLLEDTPQQTIETDDLGIASFRVEKADRVTLHAEDTQGNSAQTEVAFDQGQTLILRPEKSLYRVGETLHAEVLSSLSASVAYVDVIRDGQTILTRSVWIEDRRGQLELTLSPSEAGTLTLHAYQITGGSDMLRDTRHVYVDPADDLQVTVELDRKSYLPGQEATLNFQVSNPKGHPILAALGLWVVDESVFALQENQPGLAKVYFTLEEELLKPRYEIHAFSMGQIVREPQPRRERRESAARFLLTAASRHAPEYSLNVRSAEQKQAQEAQRRKELVEKRAAKVAEALQRYRSQESWGTQLSVDDLLRKGLLKPHEALDPWGYRFYLGDDALYSLGPDGRLGTEDDVRLESMKIARVRRLLQRRREHGGLEAVIDDITLGNVAVPEAMVMFSKNAPLPKGQVGGRVVAYGKAVSEPTVPEPRIRRYFPETLFTEAALITDAQGQARLTIPLADSITTWRLTGMVSSRTGQLGSMTTGIRVFQDFFVDIDLPVSLTRNDEVSMPVAIYNYLPGEQTIRLKLTEEPWFELLGEAEQTVTLKQNDVRVYYYRMRVKEFGWHTLTVHAYGSQMSDAIARQIEVIPDGERIEVSLSDRLTDQATQVIEIPASSVDGASKILLKIYPGTFSQILEGMDSILAMPFGCFEQTSSTTYPNILALDYLRATEQSVPEVEMKANQYISLGYQRLLSFEVDGGGFEWFGNPPANRILTAYGLMEFHDMVRVYEIDPDVIARTQRWLIGQQGSDGSWDPDKAYLHAESWGRIQNSKLLPTAYILWSLLESESQDPAVGRALEYVRAHADEGGDPYTLGIIANALLLADRRHRSTERVMDRLAKMAVEDKDSAHWKSQIETVTYSHGASADIEATALVTQALLRYSRNAKLANKALTYLVRAKDPRGTWGSTQATILVLKALLMASRDSQAETDGTVQVVHNGTDVQEIRITPETSDLMRLIDLGETTVKGKNEVRLTFEGEGNLMYQLVGRYYRPWKEGRGKPEQGEALQIDVSYDKQKLSTDDLVTCKVKVKNLRPATANMVIVDLGIPPGFEVQTPDLDELVGEQGLQKYQLTSRQVILYFDKLFPGKPVEFEYRLRAKMPIKAQTRMSRVYEYYNLDVTAVAAPVELVVE